MLRCIICGFDIELDDAAVTSTKSGRCICLRCYSRETHSEKPMTRRLQAELFAALATID